MAERDPRQGFDFNVLQGVFLDLREVANLLLRKADIANRLLVKLLVASINLVPAEAIAIWAPIIELGR